MLNLLLSSPHLGYVAGAFGVAFAALGLEMMLRARRARAARRLAAGDAPRA
jgi:hypothetical protein